MERTQEVLPAGKQLQYAADAYEAAKDADALLILTDWTEFGELDLRRLNQLLRYPILVDGRNLYDPAVPSDHGFTYVSVGRPVAHPTRETSTVAKA
jgi:UDPglucose 6-dehydrogenase